jgi:hypothetical protein
MRHKKWEHGAESKAGKRNLLEEVVRNRGRRLKTLTYGNGISNDRGNKPDGKLKPTYKLMIRPKLVVFILIHTLR